MTRVVGEGPGPCKAGDSVLGTFTIFDSVTGTFTGTVGVDGRWDWPDFTAAAISSHGDLTEYIFKGWRMAPPSQAGQVTGTGSVEHKHTNAWGYQHYRFQNVTMTLQRLQ